MNTIIYGASDDLIEIEGAVNDESSMNGELIKFSASDGTEGKIIYDDDGIWRFEITNRGTLFLEKREAVGEDEKHSGIAINASGYSDVIIFQEGIEWVKIGRKKFHAETAKPERRFTVGSLIEKLMAFPPDASVCIFDYKKNSGDGDAAEPEGSSAGVYGEFQVDMVDGDNIPKDSKPWLALSFDNPEID